MSMLTDYIRNIVFFCSLSLVLLAGCAHDDARTAFIEQTLTASSAYEKKGDLGNAVEELKVALAADNGNSDIREKLEGLVEKRDREAEKHFKAGMALRDSNLRGAKKEFLEALKIRNDYPQAVAELRKIRLAATEPVIETRLKKGARPVVKGHRKMEAAEDEGGDGDDYSLDIAISSFEAGNYDAAIREFEKMKVRYPKDPDIRAYLDRSWYYSGVALFNKKDYEKALASFARVPRGFERVDEYIAICRAALK